jgi:cell division protein FtsB
MRKAALILSLAFLAACIGVALSYRPWSRYLQQRQDTQKAVAEMRDAEERRAELLREEARYSSSLGREELARKHGYVRPGEAPVQR